MKFGQLIEEIFSLKNHAENEARRLVPDLSLFFKIALFEVKLSGLYFSFIDSPQLCIQQKQIA